MASVNRVSGGNHVVSGAGAAQGPQLCHTQAWSLMKENSLLKIGGSGFVSVENARVFFKSKSFFTDEKLSKFITQGKALSTSEESILDQINSTTRTFGTLVVKTQKDIFNSILEAAEEEVFSRKAAEQSLENFADLSVSDIQTPRVGLALDDLAQEVVKEAIESYTLRSNPTEKVSFQDGYVLYTNSKGTQFKLQDSVVTVVSVGEADSSVKFKLPGVVSSNSDTEGSYGFKWENSDTELFGISYSDGPLSESSLYEKPIQSVNPFSGSATVVDSDDSLYQQPNRGFVSDDSFYEIPDGGARPRPASTSLLEIPSARAVLPQRFNRPRRFPTQVVKFKDSKTKQFAKEFGLLKSGTFYKWKDYLMSEEDARLQIKQLDVERLKAFMGGLHEISGEFASLEKDIKQKWQVILGIVRDEYLNLTPADSTTRQSPHREASASPVINPIFDADNSYSLYTRLDDNQSSATFETDTDTDLSGFCLSDSAKSEEEREAEGTKSVPPESLSGTRDRRRTVWDFTGPSRASSVPVSSFSYVDESLYACLKSDSDTDNKRNSDNSIHDTDDVNTFSPSTQFNNSPPIALTPAASLGKNSPPPLLSDPITIEKIQVETPIPTSPARSTSLPGFHISDTDSSLCSSTDNSPTRIVAWTKRARSRKGGFGVVPATPPAPPTP